MDGSKVLILKGGAWHAIPLIVNQGFTFIFKLILAKILPNQLRLNTLTKVIVDIVSVLTELEIRVPLIQRKEWGATSAIYKPINLSAIAYSILLYLVARYTVVLLAGTGIWSLAINSTTLIVFSISFYLKGAKWFPKLPWNVERFEGILDSRIFAVETYLVDCSLKNVNYLLTRQMLFFRSLGAHSFAFFNYLF